MGRLGQSRTFMLHQADAREYLQLRRELSRDAEEA